MASESNIAFRVRRYEPCLWLWCWPSFNPTKLKSLSFLILCLFLPPESQDICSLSNNTRPWATLGFLPPRGASLLFYQGDLELHCFVPLLSGKRAGSGPSESFCRQLSFNTPKSQVCIWDRAWITQGALSPTRSNHLAELCEHLYVEAPGSCSQVGFRAMQTITHQCCCTNTARVWVCVCVRLSPLFSSNCCS